MFHSKFFWHVMFCGITIGQVYSADPPTNRYADSDREIRYLDQNWTPQESRVLY